MDSRSYIRLTGNLLDGGITPITGSTGTTGSTIITGETTPTAVKKINLGGWNMNSTSNLTRNVSSGVPLSKILSVDVVIKSDGGELFKIEKSSSNWETAGYVKVCSTPTANAVISVTHNDASGSFFRQSAFDGSISNRGWAIVTYSNIQPPAMITGNVTVGSLAATCFNISGNLSTNVGGSCITEFGVLWSQSNSNPTVFTGTKVCTLGNLAAGAQYNKTITGLLASTNTYYRAYACNCEEVGYGVVKQQITCSAATPTETCIGVNAVNSYSMYADGFITVNPPLGGGQCAEILLDYAQSAQNSGDVAELCFFKSCNGGAYYPEYPFSIDARTTYYGEGGPNYWCSQDAGTIWLRQNDCVCWCNCVTAGGGFGDLCSCFCLSIAACVNIDAIVDGCVTYNCVSN